LAFIDEGNPDIVNRKINLEKIKLIGTTITKLLALQDAISERYNEYVLDSDVQKYFDETLMPVPDDEDILYNNSTILEPPPQPQLDSSSSA
jgi:hypothetical protein